MKYNRRNMLRDSVHWQLCPPLDGIQTWQQRKAKKVFIFLCFWCLGNDNRVRSALQSLIDMDPMTMFKSRNLVTSANDRPTSIVFSPMGNQTAIVNGLDAHSVGHDSGTKLTYRYLSLFLCRLANDFEQRGKRGVPHLVFSGPNYAGTSGSAVVRAGGDLDRSDQFSIHGQVDNPTPVLSSPADSMVDAFVHRRIAAFAAQHEIEGGQSKRRSASYLNNLERSMEIEGRLFEAGLDNIGNSLFDQALKAVEMFRLGLSRTAMIRIPGGWDCHGGTQVNGPQYENFFLAIDQLMSYMSTTPGMSTPTLSDEVVIVALSEFEEHDP